MNECNSPSFIFKQTGSHSQIALQKGHTRLIRTIVILLHRPTNSLADFLSCFPSNKKIFFLASSKYWIIYYWRLVLLFLKNSLSLSETKEPSYCLVHSLIGTHSNFFQIVRCALIATCIKNSIFEDKRIMGYIIQAQI